MPGHYERLGRRIALAIFLSGATAFVISTVYQYTAHVFWPTPPVSAGPCRTDLARQYATLTAAARSVADVGPAEVGSRFLAATQGVVDAPPPSCASDPRGLEAARALAWAREHVAERLAMTAKTDSLVRNELVEAYLSDSRLP